ncbi:unnamed protein product (macronuclear) [Paramecium tetraurelia]|uniref:Protein kinase domain-containing protein n=1 Tax=Paramecium tetraurelia TaxID=5888 RepID=A0EAC7_PARTE|nr:uncharacterized protein GSPATT00024976001 [Paramecium tetraurelia]CAK92244.1 unnamed protein product [Paramecium tetraurelia]|eukprot:XP_001459641.1 hypothetical protein (macronuclear) [Paramecium tetraurelia strain d4-2]
MGSQESKQEGLIQDSRYGKATLIRKYNQICATRKVFIQDGSQHDEFVKRVKIEHPNLVKILESGIQKEQELCTTYHTMYIISEYYSTSFHKEIANRRGRGAFWTEQELWNQLLGLVDLLMKMQEAHLVHQNIRPLTISYINENTLKLCDNLFQSTAFQMAQQNPENQKIFELSPKLLEAINQNNQFPRHNLFKSDVWSLGMCILQASLLDHCRDCFDFERGHVDVSRKLALLNKNYSIKYEQVIVAMLSVDEESRPDFKQLMNFMKGNPDAGISKFLEDSVIHSSRICLDTKSPMSLKEDSLPEPLNQLREQIESKPTKNMVELEELRIKPKIVIKKTKKKDLGFYNYQEQMVIRDPSKSAIQQQNLYSYTSVDYSSNKKLVNSSHQFTNPSPQTQQFNDKEKIEQLLGYGMQSYSIDSLIMPSISIKPQISLVESSKPFSSETSKTTQQSNPQVITIDTHPSCNSTPVSYTEIPISYVAKKDINYRQEMEQMIELNRSRCFKTEQYQDGSSYVGEMYNQLRDGFGKYQFVEGGYYEGQWKQNKMHGYGTLFYGVGQKAYEGQFENDQFSGFGTLYNKEPTKLDTPFDCSNFDLIGNYWVKYVGNFQNELKDGQGALYLSNDECYKGEFYQDYVDGHGTFGSIIGVWRKNQLIK